MRVIAGSAKGCPLVAPDGLNTRPITDKIKGALFNSWQMDIPGCAFLDLFAGSGSMGIEALSRGAKSTVFVEKDRKAIQAIRQNLAKCKFTSGYEVFQDDVFRQIERMRVQERRFDIIYLDPPFTVDGIFLPVMEAIQTASILMPGGFVAIRTRKEKEMPDAFGSLRKTRKKNYGISTVHFYSE